MINHVRTLLLNQGRMGYPPDYPGEEYIPAAYQTRAPGDVVARSRRILFGHAPDRLYLNYRVQQLLELIHATELVGDLEAFDPRITYTPFRNDWLSEVFTYAVNQSAGEPTGIYLTGSHSANEDAGVSEQLWDIELASPTTVRIKKRREQIQETLHAINYSTGLSNPITLPGSNYVLRLPPTSPGAKWTILSRGRPETDIATLLTHVETTLGNGVSKLFPQNVPPPVSTWREIWHTHPLTIYRYAALLLAIAYLTERAPQ